MQENWRASLSSLPRNLIIRCFPFTTGLSKRQQEQCVDDKLTVDTMVHFWTFTVLEHKTMATPQVQRRPQQLRQGVSSDGSGRCGRAPSVPVVDPAGFRNLNNNQIIPNNHRLCLSNTENDRQITDSELKLFGGPVSA